MLSLVTAVQWLHWRGGGTDALTRRSQAEPQCTDRRSQASSLGSTRQLHWRSCLILLASTLSSTLSHWQTCCLYCPSDYCPLIHLGVVAYRSGLSPTTYKWTRNVNKIKWTRNVNKILNRIYSFQDALKKCERCNLIICVLGRGYGISTFFGMPYDKVFVITDYRDSPKLSSPLVVTSHIRSCLDSWPGLASFVQFFCWLCNT